ncbi:MAG: hypothetical protein Q7S17_08410, partial [Xanthobacteraceae bacterium]|nr:hypothetical protein [Xanthobacteraceae bacterium]
GADIVPTDRNLYMAHFLGAEGAKDFLTGMAENPDQPATKLVTPGAAAANRSVFYSPGGQPLTARQVYEKQTSRFGNGMAGVTGMAPPKGAVGSDTAMLTVNDRIAAAVPTLTALALQPGLPEDTRKTLLELTKAGITAGQPTNDEKDWQSYARAERAAGRAPLDRLQWKIAEKRAGATTVTVGGAKRISEGLGDRYLKAEDAAVSAGAELRQYEQLDKLLDDPNVYTGTAAGPISEIKKAGVTLFGLDLKGVPNAEVAKKIVDEIALSYKRKSSDASTSDFERKLYERMAPNIGDSAAGRKLLIAMRTADLRNSQQQAEVWRAHVQKDGQADPSVYTALAELEAGRRKELGGFMESMNTMAGATVQPQPTAGAIDVVDQLRKKYKGLEP